MKQIEILNEEAFKLAADIAKKTWEEKARFQLDFIKLENGSIFATTGRAMLISNEAYAGDWNGYIRINPSHINVKKTSVLNIDQKNKVGYIEYIGGDGVKVPNKNNSFIVNGINQKVEHPNYKEIEPDCSKWNLDNLQSGFLGESITWILQVPYLPDYGAFFTSIDSEGIHILYGHGIPNTNIYGMPMRRNVVAERFLDTKYPFKKAV